MKISVFKEIIADIHNIKSTDVLLELRKKYPTISEGTLMSIESQEYQRKMMRNHPRHNSPDVALYYYKMYLQLSRVSIKPGYLFELANKCDLSPMVLAKIVLEHHLMEQKTAVAKSRITKMLKDSTLIDDVDLSLEIHLCAINDSHYGPYVEPIKSSIGEQYEYKLKEHLKRLGLPFLDENELRARGYDKTPDTKLEIPLVVDNQVINWIESKAMFGDPENQQIYLKNQFWSYRNRFGPGLVIYWFGFVDELDSNRDRGILLYEDFPTNIVLMDPDCVEQEL